MRTLSTWLLGGALAASLSWNVTFLRRAHAETPAAPVAGECASTGCALPPLGLEPAQAAALEALCARTCGESERLERRADELEASLIRSLAGTPDEAETARIVSAIGDLRERSLLACIEGIAGIRALLAPAEVEALLARCELGTGGCR
jgi:hypothetical protein